MVVDPLQGPLSLLRYGRYSLDCPEQEVLLFCVTDVGVDQERVRFRVNVFHHHLEAVETASLRHLDLGHEARRQVLEHDAVGGGEESQHHLDEVLLILVKLGPVFEVLRQVDLFSRPEAGHLILIHLPDVVVFDGQDDEPVRVFLEEGLRQRALRLCHKLAGLCLGGEVLGRMRQADDRLRNLQGILARHLRRMQHGLRLLSELLLLGLLRKQLSDLLLRLERLVLVHGHMLESWLL